MYCHDRRANRIIVACVEQEGRIVIVACMMMYRSEQRAAYCIVTMGGREPRDKRRGIVLLQWLAQRRIIIAIRGIGCVRLMSRGNRTKRCLWCRVARFYSRTTELLDLIDDDR